MGDHDSLFKRAFSVPASAAAEIRCVLPEAVSGRLDLDRLESVRASFIDDEMAHRHADLLFRAPILGGREQAYVYVLLEHQSEPEPLMVWRVFGYVQRIWAAVLREEPERKTLPPIVPLIVHHGPSGWTAARRLHEVVEGLAEIPELAPLLPDFEILVDDLGAIADETLRERPLPPFPKVALWLLRDSRSIERLLQSLAAAWREELSRLRRADAGGEDTLVALRYILRVAGDLPFETLRERLEAATPELEDVMATIEEQIFQRGFEKGVQQGVEQGIQQGVEQGIQQGVEQGRAEALRDTLGRLLRARFGGVDVSIERHLEAASEGDLDRWIERVVTAERPEDIFGP